MTRGGTGVRTPDLPRSLKRRGQVRSGVTRTASVPAPRQRSSTPRRRPRARARRAGGTAGNRPPRGRRARPVRRGCRQTARGRGPLRAQAGRHVCSVRSAAPRRPGRPRPPARPGGRGPRCRRRGSSRVRGNRTSGGSGSSSCRCSRLRGSRLAARMYQSRRSVIGRWLPVMSGSGVVHECPPWRNGARCGLLRSCSR